MATEYRYMGIDRARPRAADEEQAPIALLISVGKRDRLASLDLTDEEAFRLARDLVQMLGLRAGHRMMHVGL